MPTNTTNYNLLKPLGTENYDVAIQNGNMDLIDAALMLKAPKANPTFTGVVTLPINSVSDGLLVSLNATVTAAGTNQATATALTKDMNVITSGTGGVVVQGATTGKIVVIMNRLGVAINIYPATGHYFDGLAINTPISLPANGFIELYGFSTTQWNTTKNAIIDWSKVVGTPTTLAGYGITDGALASDLSTHLADNVQQFLNLENTMTMGGMI